MSRRAFDYSFLGIGLLIQIGTYLLMPHESWLSVVSGCLGVCSVCLTSQGKIIAFAFGFAQVGTYTYLCLQQRFYAEIAINGYYFLTMLYGVYVWKKHLGQDNQTINPRHLSYSILSLIVVLTAALSGLAGWALASWTDDTQPYLDAFTTVPALVAQVLMILVYREHWLIWLAVDILSIALWLRAGDYCMTAQYAFWCGNCIYGILRWQRLSRRADFI